MASTKETFLNEITEKKKEVKSQYTLRSQKYNKTFVGVLTFSWCQNHVKGLNDLNNCANKAIKVGCYA